MRDIEIMAAGPRRLQPFTGPAHQSGMIAMIIAIIVLVCTLLGVIGLLRSVDSSTLIAGTMSFKQAVVQEGERAYAAAKGTITFDGAVSQTDNPALGYFASVQTADTTRTDLPALLTAFAPAGTPGTGVVSMPAAATATTGNSVYYVVERLCAPPSGAVASKDKCVVPTAYVAGGMTSETGSQIPQGLGQGKAAYRLTVRVDGSKNTQAYVQTVIR